jgi:Mn-dependent DtxR family transcriptional regulator
VSREEPSPWDITLLVIYLHGWEFDATPDRVRKVCKALNVHEPNKILEDLTEWGMIQQIGSKYVLTRKGLAYARKLSSEHESLREKIDRVVWSEISKQFTTLKRFMKK